LYGVQLPGLNFLVHRNAHYTPLFPPSEGGREAVFFFFWNLRALHRASLSFCCAFSRPPNHQFFFEGFGFYQEGLVMCCFSAQDFPFFSLSFPGFLPRRLFQERRPSGFYVLSPCVRQRPLFSPPPPPLQSHPPGVRLLLPPSFPLAVGAPNVSALPAFPPSLPGPSGPTAHQCFPDFFSLTGCSP